MSKVCALLLLILALGVLPAQAQPVIESTPLSLIASQILGADGAFDNVAIPPGYDEIWVRAAVRTTAAVATDRIILRVGDGTLDAGSNYSYVVSYTGATAGTLAADAATAITSPIIPGNGAPMGVFGGVQFTIFYPDDTTGYKLVTVQGGHSGSAGYRTGSGDGAWKSSAPVRTLNVFGITSQTFKAGSRLVVFGVRYLYPELGDVPMSVSASVESSVLASEAGRWFGRASVANMNGVIVLTYIENPAHPDNGDEVIHIRYSSDYGETWSEEDKHLDGSPVAGFPNYPPGAGPTDLEGPGETLLIPCPGGDLLLIASHVFYGTSAHGAWQARSTDGGLSWGEWGKIDFIGLANDDLVEMPNDYTFVGSTIYSGLIVLQDPSWNTTKIALAKSEDDGQTWTWVSDITSFSENAVEVGLEYIGDNTILAMLRDNDHFQGYRRVSVDLGETWGPLQNITTAAGIIGKPRVYTAAHLKGEPDWWNDQTIVMSGFVQKVPGVSQGRQNAVWISNDRGEHWSQPMYLDLQNEDSGYGDIFYNPAAGNYVAINYYGTLAEGVLKQYEIALE